MPSAEFSQDHDELKVKRPQAEASPTADPRANGNLMSALGNAGVQRLLRRASVQRKGDGAGAVDDEVARTIQSKQGTGQALDESARRDLEPALGARFDDVRIHNDAEADQLNRSVQAEAFTTGNDIFFRAGNYNPGSADGRQLLAHELTHVVQQRLAPPSQDLTVSSPEDASEKQASQVADSLAGGGPTANAGVARQEMPEEEEEMPANTVGREASPEEEEMPANAGIEREGLPEEEEEPMQASIEREGLPEEEEEPMQASIEREGLPEEEEEPMQASIEREGLPEEEEEMPANAGVNRQEAEAELEQPV